MTAVLRLFWNICLMRDGPETVPTHTWFLSALIAAYLAVGVLMLSTAYPGLSPMLAFNWTLIGLVVTASVAWFALYLRNHEARFPATLGAVVGAKLLMAALSALVYATTSGTTEQAATWAVTIWGVAVVGFVLHRSLATRLWVGVAISLAATAMGWLVAAGTLGVVITAQLAEN